MQDGTVQRLCFLDNGIGQGVPANTSQPLSLWMGMDSPVMDDSSTRVSPSMTVPSTGTISPAFTLRTSPRIMWQTFISSFFPPLSIVAVSGVIFLSCSMAFLALSLTASSIKAPSTMMALTMAASR